MRRIAIWVVFSVVATGMATVQAHAQIAVGLEAPLLNANFCANSLPPTSHADWDGELEEWTAGTGAGRAMVEVSLNAFPDAICNDGSAAKIYVRPAPETLPNGQNNPWRSSFHIHLKGGGTCRSFSECRARFCAAPGAVTNKPGLMSSLGWPGAIRGTGLFEDDTQNRFSHMNQVLVGSCSSDTWVGSALPETPVSLDGMDKAEDVSKIAFMGAAIVRATLDTLRPGLTVSATSAGQPDYTLPGLSDAKHLILSGDSAGANGVRHHLDRIAEAFPNTVTLGLLDAGTAVDMADARIDWSLHPSYPSADAFMAALVQQSRSFHGVKTPDMDQSCKAKFPGSDLDEQACFNGFELSRDHIETPHLQRLSLSDVTTVRYIGSLVAGLPPTIRELSADSSATMAAGNPSYSALGANCRRHVTFRNTQQMRLMQVLTGGPVLYRDLVDWVAGCLGTGSCPQVVKIAPPSQPGASLCP